MDLGYENLFFPGLLGSLALVLFARLAWMIVAGVGGAASIAGGVYRRAERPGEYWIEVALYVIALAFLCWCVLKLQTLDRLLPAHLLLLLIAICATLILRLLVKGFVSAGNRYFRRIEPTDSYWLSVAFFGVVLLILVIELLDRWKRDSDYLVSLSMYLPLALVLLFHLVRALATGTTRRPSSDGADRRGERPAEYWVDIALLALAFGCAGWMVLLAVAGAAHPMPPSALLSQIALLAVFVVYGLARGFVSPGNIYLRRIERTGAYWVGLFFLCALAAGLAYILLERRP